MRENRLSGLFWSERTMSTMKNRRLEECEKRLSCLPAYDIFSDDSEMAAEELWQFCYDAEERNTPPGLHLREWMKQRVLERLSREALLLSNGEAMLVQRILAGGGMAELYDLEDGRSAESLVRRLWCHLEWESDEKLFICMADELVDRLSAAISAPEYLQRRLALMQLEMTVQAMLYLGGCISIHQPLSHLLGEVLEDKSPWDAALCGRYFRASYEWIMDGKGEPFLVHPGLAEPGKLMHSGFREEDVFDLPAEDFLGAASGLMPSEAAAAEAMLGLLKSCTRPELTPEEAAEDLRILCKQNVGMEALKDVLSNLIICIPTRRMEQGLERLMRETRTWYGYAPCVLQ